jgi:hypothetical protein
MIHAERIWMAHTYQQTTGSRNNVRPIPKIKDGPALLQKRNILCPSAGERRSRSTACATACAPAGYPPIIPMAKMDSQFLGIRRILHQKLENGNLNPMMDEVRIDDSIIKGKREGMTVRRHNVMASVAPMTIVLVSISKINMATEEKRTVSLRFKQTTSKDSMPVQKKTSLQGIYIS